MTRPSCFILLLLFLHSGKLQAQFPFFKGIQSNNILISSVSTNDTKTSSTINYDFSNSRLAFVLNRLNLKQSTIGEAASVSNSNLGLGVNLTEGNFNLFKGEFNPGFDITKQWQWQKFFSTSRKAKENNLIRKRSRILALMPVISSGNLKTIHLEDSAIYKKESLWKIDLGLDMGAGIKWEDELAITTALSLSGYIGYRWNNVDHLSKISTYSNIQSGTSGNTPIILGEEAQYYHGQSIESLLGLIKVDIMTRIWQPDKDRKNLGLYGIGRWSTQLSGDLMPVNSIFAGVSLAKPYSDVKASFIIKFIDYSNKAKDFKDIIVISVQYGIKLNN